VFQQVPACTTFIQAASSCSSLGIEALRIESLEVPSPPVSQVTSKICVDLPTDHQDLDVIVHHFDDASLISKPLG